MSNPLVCGNCGTPNRANAKFCIGCAGRLPGLAPAGSVSARMPPMHDFERERPIAAARGETSSTSFWLHLGLVGLTMIFTFVAWCVYVFLGRPAPWNHPAQTAAPATQVHEPVRVLVPVPTPMPAPAPAPVPMRGPGLTAAAEPKSSSATEPPTPDSVSQALSLGRRPDASGSRSAPSPADSPRQAAAAERAQPSARSSPARTATTARPRRDTRDLDDSAPIDEPVVVRRPSSQPDLGPPLAPGPGPQYSWTRPATTRVADDLGPPIAVGPGPRYETRPEVRAPASAVMPSGDSGPPIAIGPGPRYDYSTPSARER